MMHRTRMALGVDELEGRCLLSGFRTSDDGSIDLPGGQPIQITFTETNTGDPAGDGLAQPDGFLRLREFADGYSPIWESNPENDGQSPTSVTLQPGQSVSQTATWDGTITQTPSSKAPTRATGQPVWHVHGLESQRPAGGHGDVPDHRSAPGRLDDQSDDLPVGPTGPAHLHRDEHPRPDDHDRDRESSLPDHA